jgi:membrane protease YdiL (CAAX protease family)
MLLFGWFRATRSLIVVVLILSSIAFGLVHISNFDLSKLSPGVVAGVTLLVMLNQGFGGLLYGAVFLKYCGLVHFKYTWGAFYTTVLMHWAWDTGLIIFAKYSE